MTAEGRYWHLYPAGGKSRVPDGFVVADGWPAVATEAFRAGTFETLDLQAFNEEEISIPPLGDAALSVRRLTLQANGHVKGLEQFKNVEAIHQVFFPKSGFDATVFPRLTTVGWNYDKGVEWVFSCPQIVNLTLEDLPDTDCRRVGCVRALCRLYLSGGRLKSLDGLEKCENLTDVGLDAIRNLESVDSLKLIKGLSSLKITDLPKLQKLDLADLSSLRILNLSGIRIPISLAPVESFFELTTLHIQKTECTGLNLDAVLSLPKLESLRLPISEGLDQHKLQEAANRSARITKRAGLGGAGKGKYAWIILEPKA
jgi:hypothetical protein